MAWKTLRQENCGSYSQERSSKAVTVQAAHTAPAAQALLRHRCSEKPGLSVFTRQAPQLLFKACHLHLVMARCISPRASQQSLSKQQHKTFGLLPAELAITTFLSLLFSLHSINSPALPKAPLLPRVTFKPCVIRMPYTCTSLNWFSSLLLSPSWVAFSLWSYLKVTWIVDLFAGVDCSGCLILTFGLLIKTKKPSLSPLNFTL